MPRKLVLALLGCACLILLSAPRAHADSIVLNGSFGTGDFTNWTYNGGGFSFVATDGTDNYFSQDANDGCSAVEGYSTSCFALLGDSPASSLSQSFSDHAGGSYIFSFYFASDGNTPASFSAQWDSNTIVSQVNPASTNNAYQFYAFAVTGTGNDTITFTSEDDDFGYLALDNVAVCSTGCASPSVPTATTPEPPTWVLLIGGLFLLAPGLRRRLAS
ncbi:MAG TPA: hypothetical protein VFP94_07305 [Terriglobales bacterium]|nr:hypothetical protein [Terriglobales bacterium]